MRQHLEVISAIKRQLDEKGIGKLMLVCVSGSHSYGWDTKESDTDYRGIFIADTNKLLGLNKQEDIFELDMVDFDNHREGTPMNVGKVDVVLFELGKALELILKGNSNVLEWFKSEPVYTTPEYLELRQLALDNLTKQVYYAYKGMATFNFKKFIKQGKRTTKKYLYIFRALMAGIYTLREGDIEPNIKELDRYFDSDYGPVYMLVGYKEAGQELEEKTKIEIEKTFDIMFKDLDTAYEQSKLPDKPDREPFNKYLLKVRRSN